MGGAATTSGAAVRHGAVVAPGTGCGAATVPRPGMGAPTARVTLLRSASVTPSIVKVSVPCRGLAAVVRTDLYCGLRYLPGRGLGSWLTINTIFISFLNITHLHREDIKRLYNLTKSCRYPPGDLESLLTVISMSIIIFYPKKLEALKKTR